VISSLWQGEPIAVLIDDAAIGGDERVHALLQASGLQILNVTHPTTLAAPTVGIFGNDCAPVPDCHAWYVGSGATPRWMHWTLGRGSATSIQILRMLGTALAQEQAAVAFRAAGAGQAAPTRIALDPAVLRGVVPGVGPLNQNKR
jgi:hypothetical protein